MITVQASVFVFISSVVSSSLFLGSVSAHKLANCTEHNKCIKPFETCDSLTGACQLFSRYTTYNSYYPTFWEETGSGIYPYYDKHTSIVCSEDGNYPSQDCRYFYRCVNGTSVLKACNAPGLPFFDPVLQRCTSSSTCPAFQCFERFNVRVGLEGQLSPYFAYCFAPILFNVNGYNLNAGMKDIFIPRVVTRCYGKDILNVNTGHCEPRCLQEGLLPDTSDCFHYFLCVLVDPIHSVFSKVRLSCPAGQAFLASEHRCVPEERVSACSTPRAWPL